MNTFQDLVGHDDSDTDSQTDRQPLVNRGAHSVFGRRVHTESLVLTLKYPPSDVDYTESFRSYTETLIFTHGVREHME